jgi:hypothetical protein
MQQRKHIFSLATLIFLLAISSSTKAQQNQPGGKSAASNVVTVAPAPLLANRLAGISASGEAKQYTPDKLAEMVGNAAPALREYHANSATSRNYGDAEVAVFETRDRFAAYGVFTYFAESKPVSSDPAEWGTTSARLPHGVVFHKGRYCVLVTGDDSPSILRLAKEVEKKIASTNEDRPSLVGRFSEANVVAESRQYKSVTQAVKYFLGPESLGSYVEHAREMFEFFGDAEAALVEYAPVNEPSAQNSRVKLVIVEYHTPQFATDAMTRVNSYLDSLPADERDRITIKREGNYIVETINAPDSEFANQLMDSVEYAYSVKWLRNPLLTTNDPFRQQKAAEMLLSSFSILGVILGTVFAGGLIFGTFIFIQRRRQQRQVFSDAGGMLRLDIDQFEATMLGLPPGNSEK